MVALDLPVRNSLTFNQYVINPTFSFVRQQYKYISVTNKREWVSFDNAPLTYLASYSGRFRENIGVGVGLFQQNHGVLTTFGGILNFAYNAQLNRDSNLTFGLNVAAYSSGVNQGNVVTNTPDPSLQNIPSNFLISVSPGINYGLAFVDIGIAVNNAVLYNFNTSELIKDDSQRGIQAHVMYTGYMYSNSFLDESKFTGLVKTEFKEGNTIISGTAMLTVPLGFWAQAGYNTLNGFHGGIGLNITKQIALEYNYEKATGDLNSFGSSHELTLAYKFNNKERYQYSREDDVSALIKPTKKKNSAKPINEKAEANRRANALAKAEAEEQARLAAEEQARIQAEEQARLAAEEQARLAAEEQAKIKAENTLPNASDEIGKAMNAITESTEDSKETQEALLIRLQEVVISKDKDLKDLKEENDLSEQGIYMEPKPFKSISAENKKLAAIKADLEAVIESRNKEIERLEELYEQREESDTINLDEVSLFYRKKLKELRAEQQTAIQAKTDLEVQLEEIKIATDFERKRRIKRAAYKNQEDRYAQDMTTLNLIKENTQVSSTPLEEEDFDFGEARSNKIKIVKNVANEENGYYVVLAVHNDTKKRDEFITKVVASGDKNINFFYDVNTSKYYIYQDKFDSVQSANNAVESNDNEPYKSKMSIVKIEN